MINEAVATETEQNNTTPAEGSQSETPHEGATETQTQTQTTPQPEDKQDPQKQTPPEEYELELPEGSHLQPMDLEEVASFAKEHKLSQEQAQALVVQRDKVINNYIQMTNDKWTEQTKTWVENIKKDREMGGEAFEANAELAKRVIARFGSQELRKALTDTGLGNHPELVRFVINVGKTMSEDVLVQPGRAASGKKSTEDILYGNSQNY